MRPYTPAEILQAGADDTRRASTHLMIELEGLHAAICWHWHRINVDEHAPLLEGEERLPRHHAPAEFGGTTLALPARPVRLVAHCCRLATLRARRTDSTPGTRQAHHPRPHRTT